MFQYSLFDGDISQWDVSRVTNLSCMLSGSKFSGDLSPWQLQKWVYLENTMTSEEWNNYLSIRQSFQENATLRQLIDRDDHTEAQR